MGTLVINVSVSVWWNIPSHTGNVRMRSHYTYVDFVGREFVRDKIHRIEFPMEGDRHDRSDSESPLI